MRFVFWLAIIAKAEAGSEKVAESGEWR